jgi:LPXTG-motif cell wall-anchored protein
MHRILAGLIAVALAAAVGVAIVRGTEDTTPIVQGTDSPTPKQTYTFNGPPPTVPMETETPIIPPTEEPTVAPTETMDRLPNTGSGTSGRIAVLMLALGLGAGLLVRRAAPEQR